MSEVYMFLGGVEIFVPTPARLTWRVLWDFYLGYARGRLPPSTPLDSDWIPVLRDVSHKKLYTPRGVESQIKHRGAYF
jgi:hypothetical protein